jgi:hypothetical protein
VQPILWDWPIAFAEPERVVVHPALIALEELDEFHPLVRFACALGLHAFEVATGLEEGPFDQRRGSASRASCTCRPTSFWARRTRATPS